jgi:ABC-type dipeptide/oligopeptide/nickel transport system ATPase component
MPTSAPAAAEDRTEPGGGPVLRVRDLSVSFPASDGERVAAVQGLGLEVRAGQTLAVVGESGSGKSMTALSILRLVPPPGRIDAGRIELKTDEGMVDLMRLPERRMRSIRGDRIAMIFQEPMTSLNPVFTIGDQIIETIRLHQHAAPKAAQRTAIEALTEVGIADPARRLRSYPHEFSGGMRQRVMIAMALACRPSLLLADEPTTALDVTIQAQILDLLRSIQRARGMAMILITHALGVVAQHADVACVMYAGRVVEYAPVPELFSRPLHPYTRGLLASIPRMGERRDRLATIREITEDPSQFAPIRTAGGAEARPWWPQRPAPEEVEKVDGPAGDSVLGQVGPEHWIGVWRTRATADEARRGPDTLAP